MADDYQAASLRHFEDAETLAMTERWGGAGHLIGFAAECALKFKIESLRPGANAPHGHFPELLEIAKKHIARRHEAPIHQLLKIANLMENWDVSLRYAGDGAVDKECYNKWRDDASRILNASNIRRRRKV